MSSILRYYHVLIWILLSAGPAWGTETPLERAANCSALSSRLERLHCYDALFRPAREEAGNHDPRPASWHAVDALERERDADDFTFRLVRQRDGEVLMSAPALGTVIPRPRLVISCQDTITRFQLHLDEPLTEGRIRLRLDTPKASAEQRWRIRDGGYVIGGGRGLPAIDTLRRLLDAGTLILGSDIAVLDGLRFDITDLRARIAPLREACRW